MFDERGVALQVQQALNDIMQERTILVIAHRLSTVEKADNIVVIDRGCVAEQGAHSELMAGGGLYSKLVQRQLLGIEAGATLNNRSEISQSWDGVRRQRRLSSCNSTASESDKHY